MSGPITIVVADDHPLLRKGVVEMLSAEQNFRVVGEAADGEQALEMIRRFSPRVAVVDVEMPRRTGLDVLDELGREHSACAVVLLTMHADGALLQRALGAGARGYVSKESAADEIVACVNLVAHGRTYVSASIKAAAPQPEVRDMPALKSLTATERQVLKLIAENKTTREIAHSLAVSPKTVENHRSNICAKLGVTGNNALTRFVLEHSRELAL